MADLGQREAKIPLRVDFKLKHVSKIPLRVNEKSISTKQKNFPCAEPELRRTSAIERNKKLNSELRKVKKLNQSSQILKDRNKTNKELARKSKPAKSKEKENPLSVFEKRIPKISIQNDDPLKSSTKEKQKEHCNHPSQQDIEFVPDERMKKLILSNRELTPNILKSCSNIKTSSVVERPSLYKKFLPAPIDPYKQILADIANCDLASEGRRISEMKYLSPVQNRGSLYQQVRFVGDPYQEAMKSIAKLRIQQKIKSCKKKVTFNLSGDDRSDNSEAKDPNLGENPVCTIQPKMKKISEKATVSPTPPSPEFFGNILSSKKVAADSSSKTGKALGDRKINENTDLNQYEKKSDFLINIASDKNSVSSTPPSPEFEGNRILTSKKVTVDSSSDLFLKTSSNNEENCDSSPSLHKKKIDKNEATFNQFIRNSMLKNIENPVLNSARTSEVRQSLFSNQSEHLLEKMNQKIFTPRPVSFYLQTQPFESISPEFLSSRTTDILSCAPINTPLVLKSLGKYELSPVCKKLEFKDSPKENKKESENSRENTQTFYLQNIMTQQKILDQLAHQECSIFMQEAQFPCGIRETLQNPIARTLNDGDEMHFVPLWRLS